MNGLEKSVSCPPEDSRPPAVGQEVTSFHEPSFLTESCTIFPKTGMECKESTKCGTEDDNSAKDCLGKPASVYSEAARLQADDCMEQSPPNPSPPPPYKWAQSLQYLLDDMQGIELFQRFLTQEGQDTRCLDFLFACRGVKKTAKTTDSERLFKLVQVLYDKKVKRIGAITDETKREIKRKISSKTDIDINIFDEAQHQVEMDILTTTYPNFLMSDLYIQHLGASQGESGRESCPASPEEPECLPTLHEDSELHFSEKQQLMIRKESLRRKLQRSAALQLSKARLETGSYLKSPYSTNYGTYHARYGSFLPTSAQDSELQSLSSDAQTDDTMSQTDSSIDYSAPRSKQKRLQKNKNMYLNKDCLNNYNFIPRTQRLPEGEKFKNTQDFHDQLIKKLSKVIEEQKVKEKFSEKLKNIEANDYSRQEAVGSSAPKPCKPTAPVFDPSFFFQQTEDNDQDILDRHVSRVFDDSGQTPVLSPVCASPPVARPANESFCHAPAFPQVNQDLYHTNSQKIGLMSPFSVISTAKHKREHDTRSSDSGAVTEWISDDNLAARSQDSNCTIFVKQTPAIIRLPRDQSRRSCRRGCSVNDSASSCVDSGISEVCEPVLPSHSNSSQKAVYRSGESATEMVHNFTALISRTSLVPAQPLAQDPSMPVLPVPDTTTNLIEARRRLEDDGRLKIAKSRHVSGAPRTRQSFRTSDSFEDGISHRKQSKKSSPNTLETTSGSGNSETTVIGYSYGQGAVPYLTRYHGKNITLKNFKSLLTKKGNFKYYFKKVENAFGTGTVLEEVSEDHAILPLWEGKVFCVIETIDDVSSTEDERTVQ